MSAPKIHVMLADDDEGLLAALGDTVAAAPDLEVVGTATDSAQAVAVALAVRPDVVVMDARMPGGGGLTATQEIARALPQAQIVVLSAHEDAKSAQRMLEAGAIAYVVKGVDEGEITEAIRRAHRGQMSIPSDLGSSLIKDLVRELAERERSESVLRRSEQRTMAILEAVPDAMVIIDTHGIIERVNRQADALFGYERGELTGQSIEVLVPERYRHVHASMRGSFISNPHLRPMDSGLHLTGLRKDGSETPVDISLSPLETDDGTKVIAAIRDVTARSIAERAREKSEQLFRGLLDAAPDAMVIVDTSGLIQIVNVQAERLFGYSRTELHHQPVDLLVPERFRSVHVRHRAGYLSKPMTRPMGASKELYGRRKDGTEVPIDISLSPMQSDAGLLVMAAIRDLSERREAQKKLDESVAVAERQRIFARLIAAQEEERLRIASDIHDDTVQAMTATSLRMQQLRRHLTAPDQVELLTRLEDAVRESIVRLRRLMFDLRPASLDRSGLAAALRELTDRLHDETPINFVVVNQLSIEPEGGIRTALYRIAQEALVNVRKHSGATNVTIELRTVAGGCQVIIADEGRGFDVAAIEAKPGHLGLISMRERAQIGGGWWTIKCPPKGGTTVEFWMPHAPDAPAVDGNLRVAEGVG